MSSGEKDSKWLISQAFSCPTVVRKVFKLLNKEASSLKPIAASVLKNKAPATYSNCKPKVMKLFC